MLNLNSIMIGTDDLNKMGEFYTKLFDKEPDMKDETYWGWQVGSCFLTIGEHSEVKGESKEPQRILLNIESKEVKEEFERIKDIPGLRIIKEPYEMEGWEGGWIATLADPDGNYFQLMTPWDESEKKD